MLTNHILLSLCVCVILCLNLATCSPQGFVALVKIYNDPDVSGTLTGTLYYNKNTNYSRTDYTIGANEIIDASNSRRFLRYNSNCEAYTYSLPLPVYVKEDSDTSLGTSVSVSGRGLCAGWQKASNASGVATVYVDGSSYICRAVYSSGKTIDFTTIVSTSDPTSSNFTAYQNWNCPSKTCYKPIDIMLVFDSSGSISNSDFQLMLNFGLNISNSFTFGTSLVEMGLVLFTSTSTLRSSLTANQTYFNSIITGTSRLSGHTCIGCGLQTAQQVFDLYGRNTTHLMMVLTDGKNNVGLSSYDNILAAVKNAGTLIFGIGVGSYNSTFIYQMASNISGVQTVFFSADYTALSNIVTQLTTSSCLDVTGTPCGKSCKGFCATNQTCVCPDLCESSSACLSGQCNSGVNGNGCYWNNITCDGTNKCFNYWCDDSVGCQNSTKSCADSSACTTDSCDPDVGCTHQNITCPTDPCTSATCDTVLGCVNTTKTCDRCVWPTVVTCAPINCKVGTCNSTTGTCYYSDKDCSSHNPCVIDSCNTNTGDCTHDSKSCDDNLACTVDSCNSTIGCTHTSLNCTKSNKCYTYSCVEPYGCKNTSISCDDGNACTDDSCDAAIGCVHTTRDCSTGNPCLLGQCNNSTGCYNTTQDCNHCTTPVVVTCAPVNCKNGVCDPSSGNCTYTDVDCTSTDKCLIGFCNSTTNSCQTKNVDCDDNNACTQDTCNGGCIHTELDCDQGDLCKYYTCDTVLGCVTNAYPSNHCDDLDPCTTDYCDSAVGCVHEQVFCPSDPCTSSQCITGVGCVNTTIACDRCNWPVPIECTEYACKTSSCNSSTGICEYQDVVCESNNACSYDYCDEELGGCQYDPIDCDDGKYCTEDSCDESTGCQHTPVVASDFCDDLNACTIDSCNNSTGCLHTNFTCPHVACKVSLGCDPVEGCLYETKDCSTMDLPDDCHIGVCENDNCVAQEISGTQDVCGTCHGNVDNQAVCFLQENQTAISLSAGALVGIIVAVAIGVAMISYGGYRGYGYYKRVFEKSSAVNDNPLYEEKGHNSNPIYTTTSYPTHSQL